MTDRVKRMVSTELDRVRQSEQHWSSSKVVFCIIACVFGAIVGACFVASSQSWGMVMSGLLMTVSASATIVTLILQRWWDKKISIVLEGLLDNDEKNT